MFVIFNWRTWAYFYQSHECICKHTPGLFSLSHNRQKKLSAPLVMSSDSGLVVASQRFAGTRAITKYLNWTFVLVLSPSLAQVTVTQKTVTLGNNREFMSPCLPIELRSVTTCPESSGGYKRGES